MSLPLQSTSWSLIQRAANGVVTDRETFAQRYEPVVRSYFAARWNLPFDHEAVADASQEVFVECFKQNGVLSHADATRGSSFRAFLYGVSRRIGANIERRLARRRESPVDSAICLQEVEQSEATLSQAFDRAWAHAVIFEAGELARERAAGEPFREHAQQVLDLHFGENLAPPEIARQLALDVHAVHRLLRRGKRDFRAALMEVMAAYSPEATEAELTRKCIDLLATCTTS